MLSAGDIARIKAEIERLEKLRTECTDKGIRERIEAGSEQRKRTWSLTNQNPRVCQVDNSV